ncbi:hypothetical protein K435DRAFT_873620 [Dendrothele bispora CBS 962.96]|uniref:Transcription elongation factor SPT5 n=1 Tax=Dendrothele bispora (strain CBS 962.96) TaxID=1314807 RepID=A0A4S8KZS8_DENBC|nr:hypothetical protein K435DRAFT_873620 [Dendrothele bispora CBS 962.96]
MNVGLSTQIGMLREMISGSKGSWEEVRNGELPLIIHVDNVDIMATLIKLKYDIEMDSHSNARIRRTFTGASEAHILADEIARAGIAVVHSFETVPQKLGCKENISVSPSRMIRVHIMSKPDIEDHGYDNYDQEGDERHEENEEDVENDDANDKPPRRKLYEEEEEEEQTGRKEKKRAKAEVSDEDEEEESMVLMDSLKLVMEEEEKSPKQIARDLNQRYGGQAAVCYTGDMNEIPQRLLMPSVHEASLWQVRVKSRLLMPSVHEASLVRKSIDLEYTARPLQILSAFQRDSLPGMIYVEARSSQQVSQAVNGLVGVYLAVLDIAENGEEVGLKFIPQNDLTPRDDGGDKKRKKTTGMRPPQQLFNFEEVVKVYGRNYVSKRGPAFVFQGDTFKDGFIEKDFKINALILEDVNPTLDEITQFSRQQDGLEENMVNMSSAGVHGIVEEIAQDVVTIPPVGVELEGQKVELPARSVRKRFKPGDHVKVMTGKNADETGLVVSVTDNVVTFLSDTSMQEVSVFSKDLLEAAEVGSGTNVVGDYELHDLVQLDLQTVGVIFKTERDSFGVLDQNGQVRMGHELRVNDNMKEVDGEGRKGRVLHIHQSFHAFRSEQRKWILSKYDQVLLEEKNQIDVFQKKLPEPNAGNGHHKHQTSIRSC